MNPSERKAALEYLSENPVTDNMHNWGVAPEVYEKSAALRNFYNVLGYSDDRKGKVCTYVARVYSLQCTTSVRS